MLDNWGVKRLADYERHESIDEMKHADRSPSASCSSKACPISRCSAGFAIGETVEEILRADLELEREAVDQLKGAIVHCESVRDFVSRDLFESILESEEEPYRLPRNPVRDDRADGPAELHPAAVEAGGGMIRAPGRRLTT